VSDDKVRSLADVMAGRNVWRSPGRAARRLAALARRGNPDAARELAEALATSPDQRVADIAELALAGLRDQRCIDAVCYVWCYRSRRRLDALLASHKWIASHPPYQRVRTALYADRADLLAGGDELVASSLLTVAGRDESLVFAERAKTALRTLETSQAREAVCTAAIEGSDIALQAVLAAGYLPRDPGRRALLLFLSGRQAEYTKLDVDGALLRAAHLAADPELRGRLAAAARASGRLEWVRAVTVGHPASQFGSLSAPEWAAARALLAGGRRWAELWRLALDAPPARAAELLAALPAAWHPPGAGPAERAEIGTLTGYARRCTAEYSLTRTLLEYTPGDPKAARGLMLSPDDRLLAAGTDRGEIWLWRLPDGQPAGQIDASPGNVQHVAFAPDGGLLVSGGSTGAKVWRLADGQPASRAYTGGHEVVVAADGRTLLTGGGGHPMKRWRLPGLRELRSLEPYDYLGGLVVSPDGTLAAGLGINYIRVWQIPSGRELTMIGGAGGPLAISPDTKLIAGTERGGAIGLWRLPGGEPAGTLTGHTGGVPGGIGPVTRVIFAPDGKLLASAGRDGTVRLWRLPGGDPVTVHQVHDPPGHSGNARGEIGTLVTTGDGELLAAGNRGGVQLWRLPDGEPAGQLDADGAAITALTASKDGGLLAAGSWAGSVHLWLPAISGLAGTPSAGLTLADVQRLRGRLGRDGPGAQAERPWIELISALVTRRHRYDIELTGARPAASPAAADIEADD
jgi:WD40 repeat protein